MMHNNMDGKRAPQPSITYFSCSAGREVQYVQGFVAKKRDAGGKRRSGATESKIRLEIEKERRENAGWIKIDEERKRWLKMVHLKSTNESMCFVLRNNTSCFFLLSPCGGLAMVVLTHAMEIRALGRRKEDNKATYAVDVNKEGCTE